MHSCGSVSFHRVFPPLGELGDCDPLEHSPELVSEFRFSPKQSEAMEADIFGRWLELRWVEVACTCAGVCSIGQARSDKGCPASGKENHSSAAFHRRRWHLNFTLPLFFCSSFAPL